MPTSIYACKQEVVACGVCTTEVQAEAVVVVKYLGLQTGSCGMWSLYDRGSAEAVVVVKKLSTQLIAKCGKF